MCFREHFITVDSKYLFHASRIVYFVAYSFRRVSKGRFHVKSNMYSVHYQIPDGTSVFSTMFK